MTVPTSRPPPLARCACVLGVVIFDRWRRETIPTTANLLAEPTKKQRRRQLPPKSLLLNRRTTTTECMKSQTTKSTANRSRKSRRLQQTTPRNAFEISRNKTYLYYLMISLMCELMSKRHTYMFLQFLCHKIPLSNKPLFDSNISSSSPLLSDSSSFINSSYLVSSDNHLADAIKKKITIFKTYSHKTNTETYKVKKMVYFDVSYSFFVDKPKQHDKEHNKRK
jgi:hypothetical protein